MKVVVDIGGTNTRVAVSSDGQKLDEITKYATPKDYKNGLDLLASSIQELTSGEQVESIVCGFPSLLDGEGRLHNVVNLPEWSGYNLSSGLSQRLNGINVVVENDVVLAGIAEAAAVDVDTVTYVTYSTGINAVKIVDGKLDKNSLGFETGHQIIDLSSDILCEACGTYGDLEALIGGNSLEKRYGMPPEQIQQDGFWDEIEKIFAIGLHNTVLHFSTEVVILGGPMMNDVSVDNLEKYLASSLKKLPKRPRLLSSKVEDAGLVGGLLYRL